MFLRLLSNSGWIYKVQSNENDPRPNYEKVFTCEYFPHPNAFFSVYENIDTFSFLLTGINIASFFNMKYAVVLIRLCFVFFPPFLKIMGRLCLRRIQSEHWHIRVPRGYWSTYRIDLFHRSFVSDNDLQHAEFYVFPLNVITTHFTIKRNTSC